MPEYDGPPPIPLDEIRERYRAELGIEVKAEHSDYIYFEDGHARVIPTTLVELPDGSLTQFFPVAPPRPRRQKRGPEHD